ncbi:type VI secretion system baseplate subunit TssF [Thalassotalea euphylliae]|uniref:Type VI secretion system baseplate subunit TssF n=1 Tax=Thalassotalea euphylliae TaxID=1655234 RepID=A0A3E0U1W3_9GAMM|nr:type VI secretion system baseplate subunit TssF [Thalassotalea euphylliae]REL30709.1 hypothetical protein DXX94_08265 [Thalassotalea euphylliae]
MMNKMLKYFEQELSGIRQGLEAFRLKFQKEAEILNLNNKGQEDPNVTRLIDSFAWVSAKNAQEIDQLKYRHIEEFIEVTSPNLFKQVPATIACTFIHNPDDFTKPVVLSKGGEVSFDLAGQQTKFTHPIATVLSPLTITGTQFEQTPFNHPTPVDIDHGKVKYCLRVNIDLINDEVDINTLLAAGLQLHFGHSRTGRCNLDIIMQSLCNIALTCDVQQTSISIPKESFNPIAHDQQALYSPISDNELAIYFQLKEFFTITDKRNYVRLQHKTAGKLAPSSHYFLDLYLDEFAQELMAKTDIQVSVNRFLMTNLFKQVSEPISVTHQELSYPIIADASVGNNLEVYSVDDLYKVNSTNQERIKPVIGSEHIDYQQDWYWSGKQKISTNGNLEHHVVLPINKALTREPNGFTAFANITCSNSNLHSLVHIGNQFVADAQEALPGELYINDVNFTPNSTNIPEHHYWDFLKLMSFNLSAMIDKPDAKARLVQFLRLFTYNNAKYVELDSIEALNLTKVNAPFLVEGRMLFVPGIELKLLFNNAEQNADYFLFSQLLNLFFASITSFDRSFKLTVEFTHFNWLPINFEPVLGVRACA